MVGYPAGTVPQEAYVAMARESVALPAIFLIINSVVNFLMAGYLIANGVFGMAMPPDKLRAIYIQQDPAARRKQLAEMEEKGFSFNKLMRVVLYGFLGVGGVGLLVSLLGCIGGVRMFQLRSYSLVVFASLMTAIPGVSPSACCCLGEIIGLWSLFVLMQPHVRMFFR